MRIPRPSRPGLLRGSWLLCCPLNCRGRHKREERVVSEALSENAEKLLGRAVALRGEYSNGYVPDRILWEAAEIGPVAYDGAAAELIANKLVETQAQTSDPATLKATPKGMRLARGV
jgi:hypothetical protein